MPKRKRRPSNAFTCDGACGREGCEKVFDRKSALTRHTDNTTYTCPACTKQYTDKYNLQTHIRAKHPEMATPKTYTKLAVPPRFKDLHAIFMFTKQMVRNNIQNDLKMKKKKWTPEDQAHLESINTPTAKHRITCEIMDHLVANILFAKPFYDCAGGFIKDGIQFRFHGGLFKASHDRKGNSRPHYLSHGMDNICIMPLGLNHRTNIFHTYGKDTCKVLRAKVRTVVPDDVVRDTIAYESDAATYKVNGKQKKRTLYASCESAFNRDAACKAQFETIQAFWKFMIQKLKTQKCRCAISGIVMDGSKTEDGTFKMSVDAIDPTKHHTKGNLRLVCRFLNATDFSKAKKRHDKDDGQAAWTTPLLYEYKTM